MSKEREIILAIRDIVNQRHPSLNGDITFSEDWGGNGMTVATAGGHTHVGFDDFTEDQLIDALHELLCKGRGLSFAGGEN